MAGSWQTGKGSKGEDAKGKGKGKGNRKGKSDGKGKAKGKANLGFPSDIPGYRWVPKSFRRKSLFATQSFEDVGDLSEFPGAKVTQLRTDSALLGLLECVVLEPAGKQLCPKDFVSTGVIICLHGMPPSPSVLQEWGTAVDVAGWTQLGCTVVIPNVQMSAALQLSDFEAIVDAALELADFSRCLIIGKAWGAQRAVEVATLGNLSGKVEGVVLVAPASPAPDACSELAVSAMLIWASDDEVSAFEESPAWMEALDDRPAPTVFLKCASGGHRLDHMLSDALQAQALRNFTAAALLIGELEEGHGSRKDGASNDGPVSVPRRSLREQRLSGELPRFLVEQVQDSDEEDDEEEASTAKEAPSAEFLSRKRESQSLDIMNWMQAGMTTAAE